MTSLLPTPEAARLRRPSWRDTRLLVGLLIVLSSMALGARVVATADDTTPVYAARVTLPAGTALGPAVVDVVEVRLGPAAGRYLSGRRPPPAGTLLRTVAAGELVPVSAVGRPEVLRRRPVGIPVEGALPAGIAPGGLVDVWASARSRAAGANAYDPPRRLAAGAEVYQVVTSSAGLAGAGSSTVHVLLGEQELAIVLDALANGARTAVVPVPGSAPSGSG